MVCYEGWKRFMRRFRPSMFYQEKRLAAFPLPVAGRAPGYPGNLILKEK